MITTKRACHTALLAFTIAALAAASYNEAGVPGYNAESWQMLVAPAGTPASVLDKLNAETNNAVASPAVREKFLQFGVTPKGTGTLSELLLFNRAEIERWGVVVRNAGIAGSE